MFSNRKGFTTFFITIVIALVVFILLIIFYNNVWGEGKIRIERQFTCKAALGIGYGECTDNCEPPNQKIQSKDCGEGKHCCISLEKPDEIMPEDYGGNKELNFKVNYIGAKDIPSDCRQGTKDYELICTPGKTIVITFKIEAENIGSKTVDVFANPTIVDQSGGLSARAILGNPAGIGAGKKQELYVGYKFTPPGTDSSRSYRIYPAAKCTSPDCKKTSAEGIYRKLEGSYMNVAFVK